MNFANLSWLCFFSASERLLQKCRQIVDMKKDDGFAPLHLAALNGHKDVTNTLLSTVRPNLSRLANYCVGSGRFLLFLWRLL